MTALVLTHGLGSSAAGWRQQVRHLSYFGRIITWDLPGHGERTGMQCADWSADHAVAMLSHLIGNLDPPLVLGGHSLGGYLALRCAISRDVRPAGLVLISSGPGFRDGQKRERWNSELDKLAARLALPPHVAKIGYLTDSLVIDELHQVAMPAVIIAGELDRNEYVSGSRYLAAHLPQAEFVTIAGAGHSPHVTHPIETNHAIRRFVNRVTT